MRPTAAGLADDRPGPRDILVGRADELRELAAALDDALAGRGSLVLLTGETGSGKTRLVREVAGWATARSAKVVWAHCLEGDEGVALSPWIQVVESWPAPVPPVAPETADRFRVRLFLRVAEFLERQARRKPLVVVLEDLHWADPMSVALLRFLAGRVHSSRMLVVATFREIEAFDAPGHTVRLSLAGLDEAEVGELISAVTGKAPDGSLAAAVRELTGGNPLFVREVAPLLEAEGVRDVLARRLATLSDGCADVLRAASVAGRDFTLRLLQVVTGHEAQVLVSLLDEACRAGIVEASPNRYAFTHALFREAAYASLPVDRRMRLHRLVGEALERHGADDGPVAAAVLAHHYFLGAGDGNGAGEKAVWFCAAAGHEALRLLAYDEADAHFVNGLAALAGIEGDEFGRWSLLLHRAVAQVRAGRVAEAEQCFVAAATIAQAHRWEHELAMTALALGEAYRGYTGHPDDVLVFLLRAALALTELSDEIWHAKVLARLAFELQYAEDAGPAMAIAAQAVEAAEPIGDGVTLGLALQVQMRFAESPAERTALATEAVEAAKRTGDGIELWSRTRCVRETVLWARSQRALALVEAGDLHGVDADMAAVRTLAGQLRRPDLLWLPVLWSATRALLDGRLDEAERLAHEALEIGREVRPAQAQENFAAQLFAIRRAQGRVGEVEEWLMEAVARRPDNPTWQCVPAVLHMELGRQAEAALELERFSRDDFAWVRQGARSFSPYLLAGFSEICVFVGDEATAARLSTLLQPAADRFGYVGFGADCIGSIHHHLGLLAALVGRRDDAVGHFEEALVRNAGTRSPRLLERTRRELGRVGDEGRALPPAFVSAPARNAFVREGDYWTVAFASTVVRLRDAKGLRDLARLLACPGREIPAVELLSDHGPSSVGGHDRVLDDRARREYRARLADLTEELEEAQAANDLGRAALLRAEIDVITDQLAAAFGLGGRPRGLGDPVERARQAVTRRIRYSLARIEQEHPVLGRHLRRSVSTGMFCAYTPDDGVCWHVAERQ